METKKRTKQDDIIEYLINSKRELQEEIRNDIYKPEFIEALKKLRDKNKKIN
jgi:hypothetical protein